MKTVALPGVVFKKAGKSIKRPAGESPAFEARVKKSAKTKPASTRLFVGNLPLTVTRKQVEMSLLGIEGGVCHLMWLPDRKTGLFYGSALVEMDCLKAAERAVEKALNGSISIQGAVEKAKRKLRVGFYPPREEEAWPPTTTASDLPALPCVPVSTGGGSDGLVDLVGEHLLASGGVGNLAPTRGLLAGAKVIALYFSASWCGPCQVFTPKLKRARDEIRSAVGSQFEVVFVSSDAEEAGFAKYRAKMPWPAVPYLVEEERREALAERLGATSLPCLVLVDGTTGEVIRRDAGEAVVGTPEGYPWPED